MHPSPARAGEGPRDPNAPALRLAIGPTGLGIELAAPVLVSCLRVTELSLAIPGLRFPLDVSGGVSRFRHKRGRLHRLAVEVSVGILRTHLEHTLRGLLGPTSPVVWLSARAAGATVGVVEIAAPEPRVLAFEIAIEARADDLHVFVHGARGANLPAPAAAVAVQAVQAALLGAAIREGSAFRVRSAAQRIVRAVLPDAGVRAPDASGVRWTGVGAQGDAWILLADGVGARPDVTVEAARAAEACLITRACDDALFGGDLDGARAHAVAALERAPRHREPCRRIADIDHLATGRAEAALATLVDVDRAHATDLDGLLVGELLREVGDVDAAIATFVRAGETERVAPLAATAYDRAADLTADPHDALVWLDLAIARAPTMARLRWARLSRRLAAGRIEDALADAEHLEAQAGGALARHGVWRRAGDAWSDAGRAGEAAALYERALRFDPKDPEAYAGLGRALIASHRASRGTALLARAVDLASAVGRAAPALALELAIALAEAMDDRPAAIARAGAIASDAPEAPRARGLEGRWRAQLGDVAGASFAFARMRDLADARVSGGSLDLASLLVEAAAFERGVRDDVLAAQRHLAVALRLAPQHGAARRAYREVGALIAGTPDPAARREGAAPSHETERPVSSERPFAIAFDAPETSAAPGVALDSTGKPAPLAGSLAHEDPAEDAARADALIQRLHVDPDDDRAVDELSERLMRLGRTHELLALLSGRLEDAEPARRAILVPRQREVLGRLAREARDAGRPEEAALFETALSLLRD